MKRKMFSMFLVLTLIASMFSFSAYADGENVWDGTSADVTWYNAADTAFYISTPAQLAGLAKLVNDGTATFEGKTVVLQNDIDLGGKNWTPIGSTANITSMATTLPTATFKGTLEGLGHKIKNISYTADKNNYNVGFFGVLGGKVKNIGFENANIIARESAYDMSSGIVCSILLSGAEISNCYVKNSKVEFVSGGNDRSYIYAGGAAGIAVTGSKINNFYTDKITLTHYSASKMSSPKYSGAIVGSFWGSTTDGLPDSARGGTNASGKTVIINNSYSVNTTFNSATSYGLIGRVGSSKFSVTNTYFDGTETKASGATLITDKDTFKTTNSLTYPFVKTTDFPALAWENDGAIPASGNADESWYDEESAVFAIAGADDLLGLSNLVANGTTFENKTVYIINDIDLSNIANWTPIGGNTATPSNGTSAVTNLFKGTLDGQNHVISGMKSTSNRYAGLFNHLGGTVQNAGMTNADITVTSGSYFDGAGAFAYAITGGKVINCYVKDSIIKGITDTRPCNIGAIAGHIYANSNVENCYIKNVKIQNNGENTGRIGEFAGVIAGNYDNGKLVSSDNANVKIKNCYAADFDCNTESLDAVASKNANGIITENIYTNLTTGTNALKANIVSSSKLKNIALFQDGFKADVYGQNGFYPILANENVTETKTGIVTVSVNDTAAKIMNTSDNEKSAYIVIGYFKDGDMTSAQVAGLKTIASGADENITLTKPENCDLIKVFVFNNAEDISPLNYAIEY